MSDIVHQSRLSAGEPLGEEPYFGALEKLRGLLDGPESPFADLRRRFHLFTHRRAAGRAEYPDLRVQHRRPLLPLTVWQRVELSGDYRDIVLTTGMASPAGADARMGRILWAMFGRLFIYLLLALAPAFLLLYLLEEFSLGSVTAWLTVGLVVLLVLLLQVQLVRAARLARRSSFHANLARLHRLSSRLLAEELELTTAHEVQLAGPGAVEKPPRSLVSSKPAGGEGRV